MSQTIQAGAAFVKLFIKDNALSAGLKKASERIKQWAGSVNEKMQLAGQSMMKVGGVGMAAAGAVGGGMLAAAKTFSDVGDALNKMSERTGFSTEALSELGYAAKQSGTDLATLEKSVKKMNSLIYDAGQGSQNARDNLNKLGLSYSRLKKLSPEEQFLTIAERLGNIKDAGSRSAMTMQIFGKSADSLIPLINSGAKGISEMREEARRLGVSMSTTDAQAATTLGDAMTRLRESMKSVAVHIGAALAPILTDLTEQFTFFATGVIETIKANRELIVTIAKLTAVVGIASAAFFGLGTAISAIGKTISAIAAAVAVVFKVIAVVFKVIAFVASVASFKFIALAAVIGTLIYYSGILGAAFSFVKRIVSGIGKTWQGVINAIKAGRLDIAMRVIWSGIRLIWTKGVSFLKETWNSCIWAIKSALNSIGKAFANVITPIIQLWNNSMLTIEKAIARVVAFLTKADVKKMEAEIEAKYKNKNSDADSFVQSFDKKQEEIDKEFIDKQNEISEERLKAEKDYNDALAESAALRKSAMDAGQERITRAGKQGARETESTMPSKASSGTFSAFAIQSLQGNSNSAAEETAKNTEEIAKYVKRQYEKSNVAVAG